MNSADISAGDTQRKLGASGTGRKWRHRHGSNREAKTSRSDKETIFVRPGDRQWFMETPAVEIRLQCRPGWSEEGNDVEIDALDWTSWCSVGVLLGQRSLGTIWHAIFYTENCHITTVDYCHAVVTNTIRLICNCRSTAVWLLITRLKVNKVTVTSHISGRRPLGHWGPKIDQFGQMTYYLTPVVARPLFMTIRRTTPGKWRCEFNNNMIIVV